MLCALGDVTLVGLSADWGWWRLAPGLVISGVGSGLLNAALARMAVESVPTSRTAMGSGANNTARYIGASMGVAIVVAIATSGPTVAQGANAALVVAALIAAVGALAALCRTRALTTRGTRQAELSPASDRGIRMRQVMARYKNSDEFLVIWPQRRFMT